MLNICPVVKNPIMKPNCSSGCLKNSTVNLKAEYIITKLELVIAPVWLPGVNDEEIPKVIEFAKSIKARIGIQNFLPYKRGRNPVTPKPMEQFYSELKKLEQQHTVQLIQTQVDFDITNQSTLATPMQKGDIVTATIVAPGRYPGEKIAACKDRAISVRSHAELGKQIKLKIVRNKHNIYLGESV